MKTAGFILTGLRIYRNGAHSPHILDFSVTNDWFGMDERESNFALYEHLTVWPITRLVLHKLILNKVKQEDRRFTIDDFAVWHPSDHQAPLLICTESEFFLAHAALRLTRRQVEAGQRWKHRLTVWRHIMENFMLLLLILICSACEIGVQLHEPLPVPPPVHASAFVYDEKAGDVSASQYLYDADAPALHARHFRTEP